MITNNIKIKIFFLLIIVVLFWQISKLWSLYLNKHKPKANELVDNEKPQQVLVTVYYEALCPDSRNFIVKQLLPTYDTIQAFMEVQLVPYGKAETIVTNDDYVFKCQHGEIECEANIIHACLINKIKDSRRYLELVVCMIKNNKYPLGILKSCASEIEEYKSILNCAQSIEGRRLLMKYGELTNALSPRVSFIPTITLDNEMDNQILILKNLLRQVCQRLDSPPKECAL